MEDFYFFEKVKFYGEEVDSRLDEGSLVWEEGGLWEFWEGV